MIVTVVREQPVKLPIKSINISLSAEEAGFIFCNMREIVRQHGGGYLGSAAMKLYRELEDALR